MRIYTLARWIALLLIIAPSVAHARPRPRVILVANSVQTEATQALLQRAGIKLDNRHGETIAADCAKEKPSMSFPAPAWQTKFTGDERVLVVMEPGGNATGLCWRFLYEQPMRSATVLIPAAPGDWPEVIELSLVNSLRTKLKANGVTDVSVIFAISGDPTSRLKDFARR